MTNPEPHKPITLDLPYNFQGWRWHDPIIDESLRSLIARNATVVIDQINSDLTAKIWWEDQEAPTLHIFMLEDLTYELPVKGMIMEEAKTLGPNWKRQIASDLREWAAEIEAQADEQTAALENSKVF